MDTIVKNSTNKKISDFHRLFLNLSDKIKLKRNLYQILAYTINGKI